MSSALLIFPASMRLIALFSVFLFACGDDSPSDEDAQRVAVEEYSWTQLSPNHNPPAERHQVMVYDSARERIVNFTGSEVWEWDGTDWFNIATTNHPTTIPTAMAYDAERGKTVLLADGEPGTGSETWLWDGTNWEQAHPSTSPDSRYSAVMAYDPEHARVIMFGGYKPESGINCFADTWEWNGQNWAKMSAEGPSARYGHAMTFDSKRKVVVLFGGLVCNPSGGLQRGDDHWEWNGTKWTQRTQAERPSARYNHAMMFHDALGLVMLFSGESDSNPAPETWSWNGTVWKQLTLSPSPSGRESPGFAYFPPHKAAVLFGGHEDGTEVTDTWELRPK